MTKRTNNGTPPVKHDPDLLDELFSSDDYDARERYDLISGSAVGRIIAAITGLGGMVAFYPSSDDNAISFTVGFGDKKKRYTVDCDEQLPTVIEHISNTYNAAWVKRNPGRLSALLPAKPEKSP